MKITRMKKKKKIINRSPFKISSKNQAKDF